MPGRDVECVELRVLVSVRPVVMAGRGEETYPCWTDGLGY